MIKRLLCFVNVMVLIFVLCSCGTRETNIIQEETNVFKEEIYVGSMNSDVYHYSDCKWAKNIKSDNEIWFENIGEAVDAGYRSCKTCNP